MAFLPPLVQVLIQSRDSLQNIETSIANIEAAVNANTAAITALQADQEIQKNLQIYGLESVFGVNPEIDAIKNPTP